MRIAFDYKIFSTQKYGGISRYFYHLAMGLASAGNTVSIVAPIHGNDYLQSMPHSMIYGRMIQKKEGRTVNLLNHLLCAYKMRQWRPDIVHETYYTANSTTNRKTPRVATVYDMTHELHGEAFGPSDPTSERKRKTVVGKRRKIP